jgi:hypothetical protein
MNYKPLINIKLQEFQKEFPNYTLGEIMYGAISTIRSNKDFKKADLLEISDEEMYKALSKSFAIEQENT